MNRQTLIRTTKGAAFALTLAALAGCNRTPGAGNTSDTYSGGPVIIPPVAAQADNAGTVATEQPAATVAATASATETPPAIAQPIETAQPQTFAIYATATDEPQPAQVNQAAPLVCVTVEPFNAGGGITDATAGYCSGGAFNQ